MLKKHWKIFQWLASLLVWGEAKPDLLRQGTEKIKLRDRSLIGDSDLIDYAQIIMFANIKLTVVEFLSGLKVDENL